AKVEVLKEVLELVSRSRHLSFVTVLKKFGSRRSEGILSFPFAGYTLTLDLRNVGPTVLKFMTRLDELVGAAGGRLYLAKDARMSADFFHSSYEGIDRFKKSVDESFSS